MEDTPRKETKKERDVRIAQTLHRAFPCALSFGILRESREKLSENKNRK